MRLTLRTLLAWMDDTLPPSQVREIGNQVAESPFAQELVERIRRVTRQRRLTVPKSTGPEWIDPNLVASYLDNDLDAEQVAEVEKQCLSNDVCLAEVASAHQILSLLGQRAKVPPEVRDRMHQLVKGRETTPSETDAKSMPRRSKAVVKPIQSWIERETASHSRRESLALLAGCLACFAVLGVSAWFGLSTSQLNVMSPISPVETDKDSDTHSFEKSERGPTESIASPELEVPESLDSSIRTAPSEVGPTPNLVANTQVPKTSPQPAQDKPVDSSPSLPAALPTGSVGLTEKGEHVLLRYDDLQHEWVRLTDATTLNPTDRLACLAPFQASLDLASIELTMLGGSEVRLGSPTKALQSRIEPRTGRLKALKSPRGSSLALDLGSRDLVILDLSETPELAIERISRPEKGQRVASTTGWAIYCSQGKLTFTQGDKSQSVNSPVVLSLNSEGKLEELKGEAPPSWVAEVGPSATDREAQAQFLRSFHAGRPVLAEVVTATEDNQESTRRFAISALTTLGDLSYVMPLLDRKDSPAIRRDAIAALRGFMSQGPEATAQAREQIMEEFGESTGPIVERMLIGYTLAEAAQPDVLRKLVSYLEPDTPSVGVRELSIDNLSKLSGRDYQGYNPDNPDEGSGLANWKKLLSDGMILPGNLTTPRR